jgi:hypothetical protein
MALPKQVQRQMKEIEAIEKQLKGEVEVTDEAPDTDKVEKVVETLETPEAQPVVEETPETEVAELEEQPKKPDEDAAVWKQKYKTLQGMYDKEVPQLHSKVKDMSTQLEELQASLKTKETVVKQAEKLVTDDDVKNFGEDLIEVQRKVAREVAAEFQTKLDTMQSENNELRELLGTTDSRVAESSFQNRLHRLVPDFDQLNDNPKWVAWLDEVDPVLRGPRRSVAQQAFATGDAEGVAHYVDMFRSSQVEPTPDEKPKQTQELERQIQPSRTASSSAKTSQTGKNYTNSQIEGMFKKAATLHGSGRFDEANKLEAEIDAAFTQGRVSA